VSKTVVEKHLGKTACTNPTLHPAQFNRKGNSKTLEEAGFVNRMGSRTREHQSIFNSTRSSIYQTIAYLGWQLGSSSNLG
jgi:hypothetical protein